MQNKVTIIGSGTSALLTALSISKLGLNVDIFSDASERQDSNLVTFLSSNSIFFLNEIGLNNVAQSESEPIHSIECYYENKNSHEKTALKFNDLQIKNFGKIIKNKYLYNSVLEQVKLDTKINIKKSKINSIQLDNGFVNISIDNEKCFVPKLLIIPEKKNIIFSDFFNQYIIQKDFQQTALSIEAKLSRVKNNTAYQFFTKDGPLAILPMKNDSSSLVWSLNNQSKLLQYSKDQLENEILKYIMPFVRDFSIQSIDKYPLSFNFFKKMTYKNLIILGEAAHTIHPLAGQGLNLSIKDIGTLVNIFKKYLTIGYDVNDENILKDFSNQRLTDNAIFSFSTMFMSDFFLSKNKLINKSIETSFKFLDRFPYVKRKIIKSATGKNFIS